MVTVGLLGAGFIGAIHAQAYAAIDDARLVAVADVDRSAAERLATAHNARTYGDLASMLADDEVQAVDICVPTFLHEESVIAAAQAGKHVFVEKPVALTVEQVDHMIAAVEQADVIAMVAQVIRFWPQYVVIRDLFEGGELGRPLMTTAARIASMPRWGSWFADPELSGGAVLDMHIHDLDFVCSLLGRPVSVYALGVQSETGAWDYVVSSLDFGHTKAVVEGSFLMPEGWPFLMHFKLLGTAGCVEFRMGGAAQVDKRDEAVTDLALYKSGQPVVHPAYSTEDAYVAETRYFIQHVGEGKQPAVATLHQAREVLEVALAARRSLESGAIVAL